MQKESSSFPHWVLRIMYAVVLIPIAALLCLIVINVFKDALDPETAQTAQPVVLEESALDDNGYVLLMGADTPGQTPEKAGRAIIGQEFARYRTWLETGKAPPADYPANSQPIAWKALRCGNAVADCIDHYRQHRAEIAQVWAAEKERRALYDAILQKAVFRAISPPMAENHLPSYRHLMEMAELNDMQAVLDILDGHPEAGMKALLENARFAERLSTEAGNLIQAMVGVSMQYHRLRLLSALMTRDENLIKPYAWDWEPILRAEPGITAALQSERRMAVAMMLNLRHGVGGQGLLHGEEEKELPLWKRSQEIGAGLLFDANNTANLADRQWRRIIAMSELPPPEVAAASQALGESLEKEMGIGIGGVLYAKNPVGKILANIASPNYQVYLERLYDLWGWQRLVHLQIQRAVENVPPEGMVAWLEKTPENLRDPYTLRPMAWDEAERQLAFTGRQPQNRNYQKSPRYTAKING